MAAHQPPLPDANAARAEVAGGDDLTALPPDGPGRPLAPAAGSGRRPEAVELGDFRIRGLLGTGTQGIVYLAHQASRDRPVALKVLAGRAARAATTARFRRQAALLARLDHPAVVRCYGAGAEPGFDYLALEYVAGVDAAALLRRAGGTLAPADALAIARRSAEGLAHAAARHVIHRDLKPANVLVGWCGAVKLIDWGAAKPTDEDHGLTGEHVVIGTVRYAAPEQVRDARRADRRSDIYALGVVLYELLTGRVPYTGDDWLATLLAKEEEAPPPPSGVNPAVPARFDAVLARMLAPDPADRYPDYESLIGDLDGLGLARERPGAAFGDWAGGPATVPAPGPPLAVLLVYDEGEYVPLVQHALHAAGVPYDLTLVEDGREAAAAARGRRPDVLILGLTSPTEASVRVLAGVRGAAPAAAPAVYGVSRSPDGAALLRGLCAGAGVWVTGFADLAPLSEAVREVYIGKTLGTEAPA